MKQPARNGKRPFMMRIKSALEIFIMLAVDLAALMSVFKLSSYLRGNVLPHIFEAYRLEYLQGDLSHVWWIFPIWLFFLSYEGLYTGVLSFWDEVKAIWKVSLYSVITIFTLVSIGKLTHEVSRTVIMLMGGLSFVLLPAARYACKAALRKIGLLRRNTLIVGAGETGAKVLKALRAEPNYGYRVLGFVDDDTEKNRRVEGLKVHSGTANISRYIKALGIQDVFIAVPEENWNILKQMINHLQYQAERVFWIPGFSGIAVMDTKVQHFFHEQVMALEIKNNLNQFFNVFIKRTADIIASLLMMPLLLPVMLITIVAIRLDSRGVALYSHERIGRNNRHFRCLKFRTMYEDADQRLKRILEDSPESRREWEKHWKLKDDPRVTRVGKFLRRTSLDELPQIINVLIGQMSLVGPRPYLPREWDSLMEQSETILSVRPGITGLWQVSGRSTSSYKDRLSLDAWYVRNWNPWIDIIIILKTVRVVFMREGAW